MSDLLKKIADDISDPRTYHGMRAFKGDCWAWHEACQRAWEADIMRALFTDNPLPAYMAGINRYKPVMIPEKDD